jgi:DNA-binding transcriptional LysR family regulator
VARDRNLTYKGLTLQQLRSLCETGRLGSFWAAAKALDVSHPTVWKQVHALQREFGLPLVETHRYGCQLTEAGRLLIDMAGPAVESMATLKERFNAKLAETGTRITIAVTPRLLVEDLAPHAAAFRSRSLDTHFRFLETSEEGVVEAVEARRADFGFSPTLLSEEQQRTLIAEPCYWVEARLITPKGHPLARRRTVHPRDLRPYPLVNSPYAYPSSNIRLVLDQYQVGLANYFVRADYTASIRRFVELGCGIGLIYAVPSMKTPSRLHERSMSRFFNDVLIHVLRRQGSFQSTAAESFIKFIRQKLGKSRRK